jgi:signal transduction histidine kinase
MPNSSLNALILCPTGQDASLIGRALMEDSIESVAVENIRELFTTNFDKAGVIILAEEAFTTEGIELLNESLSAQEPWSDIPIILLTSVGIRNKEFKLKRIEMFVSSGNVTLLERPLRPLTLKSATHVSLRARKRQFQVRDLLVSQTEATNIRDEFISIASHELKTPLTSLKLQTQMTRRQIKSPEQMSYEKMKKQLDYTINQIDRLNKLVDDMLDVSRISTGKLLIKKTNFNLSELLEELVERFLPQFEAVKCTVHREIYPEVYGVWDSYKIEQVINNLLSNAIRYSPHKNIFISLSKSETHAILKVQDEGMGIAEHNLERIFERFERISSVISGLGLGLYITRQIVNLHNGSIKVESQLGVGSTFIIELPL